MESTGARLPTYWLPDHNKYDHGSSRLLALRNGSWDHEPSVPSGATTPRKPLAEEDLERSTLDVYNDLVREDERQYKIEIQKSLPFDRQPRLSISELVLSKVQSFVYPVSLIHLSFSILLSSLWNYKWKRIPSETIKVYLTSAEQSYFGHANTHTLLNSYNFFLTSHISFVFEHRPSVSERLDRLRAEEELCPRTLSSNSPHITFTKYILTWFLSVVYPLIQIFSRLLLNLHYGVVLTLRRFCGSALVLAGLIHSHASSWTCCPCRCINFELLGKYHFLLSPLPLLL